MPADANQIFDFERDFAGSLRCIPMFVRLKLDLCGIKLSLRQWSRFDRDDRTELVVRPCDKLEYRASYRSRLERLIRTKAGEEPRPLPPLDELPWANTTEVPAPVSAEAVRRGLAPPEPAAWAALTRLERFALVKLTRPGHDNDNFAAAMREFGLMSRVSARSPTAMR
jgi:hypothetical protein